MARRRLNARKGGGLRLGAAGAASLALLVVAGGLVALTRQASDGGVQATADDLLAGPAGAAGAAVEPVGDLGARLAAMWGAKERIEALERENARLKRFEAMAMALSERTARYEALLRAEHDGMADLLQPDAGTAARLVLDAGGPFRRTAVAQAGAMHGVRRGHVAVNERGLVGRVVLVGERTSRVLLLDDFNSRVPVMGLHSRVRAVLVGASGAAPRLEGPILMGEPRLDYVVGLEGLREDEPIVTSGDGGLFPTGVPVGVARPDGAGRWRVKLAAAQAPVDFVRILPFAAPQRPEDALASEQGEGAPVVRPPSLAVLAAPPAVAQIAPPPPRPAVVPPPRPVIQTTPPPQDAPETEEAVPAPEPEPAPGAPPG